jgi:hypothetical protein
MFWVIPTSFSTPGFYFSIKSTVVLLGGTIFLVSLLAAVVILLVARPLEKFFAKRGYRTLSAALAYLVLLFGLGFVIAALGYAVGYSGGIWFVTAGMTLCVSSSVAFVGRLVYPSLKANPEVATVAIVISTALASFGLLSLVLQPLLH